MPRPQLSKSVTAQVGWRKEPERLSRSLHGWDVLDTRGKRQRADRIQVFG